MTCNCCGIIGRLGNKFVWNGRKTMNDDGIDPIRSILRSACMYCVCIYVCRPIYHNVCILYRLCMIFTYVSEAQSDLPKHWPLQSNCSAWSNSSSDATKAIKGCGRLRSIGRWNCFEQKRKFFGSDSAPDFTETLPRHFASDESRRNADKFKRHEISLWFHRDLPVKDFRHSKHVSRFIRRTCISSSTCHRSHGNCRSVSVRLFTSGDRFTRSNAQTICSEGRKRRAPPCEWPFNIAANGSHEEAHVSLKCGNQDDGLPRCRMRSEAHERRCQGNRSQPIRQCPIELREISEDAYRWRGEGLADSVDRHRHLRHLVGAHQPRQLHRDIPVGQHP